MERVSSLARQKGTVRPEGDTIFIWLRNVAPDHWPTVRPPSGDQVHPITEIAQPELVALPHETRAAGQREDAALTAMASRAGIQKLRHASRDRHTINHR